MATLDVVGSPQANDDGVNSRLAARTIRPTKGLVREVDGNVERAKYLPQHRRLLTLRDGVGGDEAKTAPVLRHQASPEYEPVGDVVHTSRALNIAPDAYAVLTLFFVDAVVAHKGRVAHNEGAFTHRAKR